MPAVPLRISARWANALLFSMFRQKKSATEWIESKPGGWNKGRNMVEAMSLARVLDLTLMEYGRAHVERSSGMEVLLRRLHSIYLADTHKNWCMAEWLEEVPGPNTPHLHENLYRDLMNAASLSAKFRATVRTGGSGKETDKEDKF